MHHCVINLWTWKLRGVFSFTSTSIGGSYVKLIVSGVPPRYRFRSPGPRDAADRWNVETRFSGSIKEGLGLLHVSERWASPADLADVRTCVAAEQREGTPL
jgi:hypothetical protein